MTARVTRSASRASTSMAPPASPSPSPSKPKRLPPPSTPTRQPKRPKTSPESPYVPPTPRTTQAINDTATEFAQRGEKEGTVLLHPELKFKYEDAKRHLISTDSRWANLMDNLVCKPFEGEQTEPFNPFKSLVSSILGQQVSWLAARSIQHKFCRLFTPSLPEKLPPPHSDLPKVEAPFPTPHQVANLEDRTATLRSAGLSGRKVEYVIELAERFVDGRLDARKLWEMDDDEVMKTLTEVRGIGVWTVHMFLIFSMKRGDVLPVGDLGIQKNLCRWYSQDPTFVPAIHPRKLVNKPTGPKKSSGDRQKQDSVDQDRLEEGVGKLDELGVAKVERDDVFDLSGKKKSEEEKENGDNGDEIGKEDERGTAGRSNHNDDAVQGEPFTFPDTTNNLTPATLRYRLSGKKVKGNNYLLPLEMEELMKPWEPYRSVACYFLWAVTDSEAGDRKPSKVKKEEQRDG
ncbi:hypothetical protein JCM10212_004810 [Sporobolomyces blumeae]